MNKTILLLIITLLTIPFALANIPGGSAIDASLLNYQPAPAQPGDLIDVWVQIHNNGGTTSRAGTISFLDSENFRAETSADRVKEYRTIPAGNSFLVRTQIRVSKDANEGEAFLRVRIQEQGSESHIDRQLPITITGKRGAISIVSATTEPQEILPGQQGTLHLRVENVGDSEVRNLAANLDFSNLYLAPVGSSNSRVVRSVSPGAQSTFEFPITAMPSAAADVYQLPIRMSFDDEQGNERVQEEMIGIIVGAEPQLLVYFDRVDITEQRKEGQAVLRFVNHGLSEIKLLQFEVLESDNIQVTSESATLYVGNIRADDFRSANLRLRVSEQEQLIPIQVSFKDSLNREYTETFEVALNLREGDNGGFGLGSILVLLIIVGGAFWFYKRRQKKNKRK